jgi:hypothetical protein
MSDLDADMMRDPDQWPRWPVLPLKKPSPRSFPEFGFLYSRSAKGNLPEPVTLYKGAILDVAKKPLNEIPQEQFETIEKLREAGWVVD